MIPAFLICTKETDREEWRPEFCEVELAEAIDTAKRFATGGAYAVCVMQVGGIDALPMFTFLWAKKGGR